MKKHLLILVAVGMLAACSSTAVEPTPADTSTSASAQLQSWAGQVCTDTSALKTSIADIGDAVANGGADVQASITSQFDLIQAAAQALSATVGSIPAGDEGSPDAMAVQNTSAALNAAVSALGASVADLKDTSGLTLAAGLVSVGLAAKEAGQAAVDTVKAIDAATKNRSAEIGQAFDASPSCAALRLDK